MHYEYNDNSSKFNTVSIKQNNSSRLTSGPMSSLARGSWPDSQFKALSFSCGSVLKSNQKVVGCFYDVHDTTVPVDLLLL